MRTLAGIVTLVVLGGACGGSENSVEGGSQTARAEAGVAAESERTHLGGCILINPTGEVPADLYRNTGVVATEGYAPFTRKLTVCGITLVARDDASREFLELVAKTITEIFPRDEGLDLELQQEVIRNLYRYRATIPVPVGEDFSFLEVDGAAFERLVREDSICDIIMEGVSPGQVMEVVEHILHFVSDMGLHYTFPAEWGVSRSSDLYRAMQRAIDEGYYVVDQYSDIEDAEEYDRVLLQEFAYWFITTAWNLQEPYGPIEPEWTIRNAAELRTKLPDFYRVYEQTVERVMVPPSLATLAEIGPTRAEEGER